ncbi:MAG: DUF1499 domain-containing protein [Planctomycetota bacterium]|nr:DUF1499 domain-containing protein [Planctomycetota bacterium]
MKENCSKTVDKASHRANESKSQNAANDSQNPKPKTPLSVILTGLLLTILTILALQVDNWSRDWICNTSQTDPYSTDPNLRPVDCLHAPHELADLVIKVLQEVPRWELVEKNKTGEGTVVISLVHKTFFLGFKDDIQVTIRKTQTGSRLSAKSQSRIGKGDLGQNPRNLKELISLLRQNLTVSHLVTSPK